MVPDMMNPLAWLRKHLDDEGGNDPVREMVKAFAEQLMSAEADALCGAAYGERSDERTNRRNGYRPRTFDTRAGTIELDIPKLRAGSYFPDWLARDRPREPDPFVALWSTCIALRRDRLPDQRVVIRLDFTGFRPHKRYWLLLEHGEAEICKTYPGLDERTSTSPSTPKRS